MYIKSIDGSGYQNYVGRPYVVTDRGGAIKGNKIDIYFDSHAEALAWGVKYLPVKVVE